eukprot:88029_1
MYIISTNIIKHIIITDSNCEGDKYVKQKDEVYQFSFDMQCNEKIINLLSYCSIQFLGMEFLQGKSHYNMNQNFKDTEKEIKVAVLDGEQVTIIHRTYILLQVFLWNIIGKT